MGKISKKPKKNENNNLRIAYCGVICMECPAYIGTQTHNLTLLEETAKNWAKEFGRPCRPEDILCDGCRSSSQQICSYVVNCEIRRCCKNEGLENCSFCDEYPCNYLEEFFTHLPHAKNILDKIRNLANQNKRRPDRDEPV